MKPFNAHFEEYRTKKFMETETFWGKKNFCHSCKWSVDSRKHATLFVYVLCHFLYTLEPAPWQMWWRVRAAHVSGAAGGDNRKQTGWNWRWAWSSRRAIKVKMEEITATHWNESASRLQTSACKQRRSCSHAALPHFSPRFFLFVGDIVIYVQDPFSLHPFVGWAIIHPGPAARGAHRNKSAGQDLWWAHFGHCFCLFFCFCRCFFFFSLASFWFVIGRRGSREPWGRWRRRRRRRCCNRDFFLYLKKMFGAVWVFFPFLPLFYES